MSVDPNITTPEQVAAEAMAVAEQLRAENEQLRAANDHLGRLLQSEFDALKDNLDAFNAMGAEQGAPSNWFLGLMALAFGKAIEAAGAANGVTLDTIPLTDPQSGAVYGPYTIAVTHKGAKSPAEWVAELQAENERLRDALRWCGGSPSFAPEGEAHAGWQKVVAPLLQIERCAASSAKT